MKSYYFSRKLIYHIWLISIGNRYNQYFKDHSGYYDFIKIIIRIKILSYTIRSKSSQIFSICLKNNRYCAKQMLVLQFLRLKFKFEFIFSYSNVYFLDCSVKYTNLQSLGSNHGFKKAKGRSFPPPSCRLSWIYILWYL